MRQSLLELGPVRVVRHSINLFPPFCLTNIAALLITPIVRDLGINRLLM